MCATFGWKPDYIRNRILTGLEGADKECCPADMGVGSENTSGRQILLCPRYTKRLLSVQKG